MTALIENDTLEGLSDMGTELGLFLTNITPGLGKFILIIGVFVAIAGVVTAIIYVIKKVATKKLG